MLNRSEVIDRSSVLTEQGERNYAVFIIHNQGMTHRDYLRWLSRMWTIFNENCPTVIYNWPIKHKRAEFSNWLVHQAIVLPQHQYKGH